MHPILAYLLGVGSGLLLAYLNSIVAEAGKFTFRRVTKTNKPLFSTDTAKTARLALTRAVDVFQQSCDQAGSLGYPWTSRGLIVTVEDIHDGLSEAETAINDEHFRECVKELKIELAKLHQWTPRLAQAAESISVRELRESDEAKAARIRADKVMVNQEKAAEVGLKLAEKAQVIFNKLNMNG